MRIIAFQIKAISIFNNSADNVVKEEDNVVKDDNVFNSLKFILNVEKNFNFKFSPVKNWLNTYKISVDLLPVQGKCTTFLQVYFWITKIF